MKAEFNLCEEPWILVMGQDCSVRELSLPEVLIHAHEYVRLSGEMPAQDVAVLRLLLAVLHRIYADGLYKENGEEERAAERHLLRREPEVRSFWKSLWKEGRFSEKRIQNYFSRWRERFWLFHDERPFWQVKEAEGGTEYTAAKLNGELAESSNKLRLFPACSGAGKESLSYAQAARWLLHVNAYDDTSAKPKGKDLPSPGAGWLGKIGLITAEGNNLFETLMLNFTLLRDGHEAWADEENSPVWEREKAKAEERSEIAVPGNQSELLSLQSRRLLLMRQGDRVLGYRLLGGDFFNKTAAHAEQMTVWQAVQKSAKEPPYYQPRRHDPSRQLWRDFGAIFLEKQNIRMPGVVSWNASVSSWLKREQPGRRARFRITAVHYGDKDFFIDDAFTDTLSFQADLLTELGALWMFRIEEEVQRCEKLSLAVGRFAQDLDLAGGGDGKAETGQRARASFYSRVDIPFRHWLQTIDAEMEGEAAEQCCGRWKQELRGIALKLGEEIVHTAGPQAYIGREVEVKADKKSGKKRKTAETGTASGKKELYCAPYLYQRLLRNIQNIMKH